MGHTHRRHTDSTLDREGICEHCRLQCANYRPGIRRFEPYSSHAIPRNGTVEELYTYCRYIDLTKLAPSETHTPETSSQS